jgi:hypothetical protein
MYDAVTFSDLRYLYVSELGCAASFTSSACCKDQVAVDVTVVRPAEPAHVKRFRVVIVVCLNAIRTTYLTRLLLQTSCPHRVLRLSASHSLLGGVHQSGIRCQTPRHLIHQRPSMRMNGPTTRNAPVRRLSLTVAAA